MGSLRQRGGLVCNGSREETAFAHLFRDTSKEKHMGPKWGQSWGGGQRWALLERVPRSSLGVTLTFQVTGAFSVPTPLCTCTQR